MERTNKGENEWNVQIAGGKGGKKQTASGRNQCADEWKLSFYGFLMLSFIGKKDLVVDAHVAPKWIDCHRRPQYPRGWDGSAICGRIKKMRQRSTCRRCFMASSDEASNAFIHQTNSRRPGGGLQPPKFTHPIVSQRQNKIPPLWQRCVLDSGRMTTGPQSALRPLLEDVISWFQADWLILYEFFKFQSKWRRFKCRE